MPCFRTWKILPRTHVELLLEGTAALTECSWNSQRGQSVMPLHGSLAKSCWISAKLWWHDKWPSKCSSPASCASWRLMWLTERTAILFFKHTVDNLEYMDWCVQDESRGEQHYFFKHTALCCSEAAQRSFLFFIFCFYRKRGLLCCGALYGSPTWMDCHD